MKQKDVLLVVVVAIVSAGLSLLLTSVFAGDSTRKEKVEVVEKITSEFTQPNDKYFNDNSINPTQLIRIGNGVDQSTQRR